MPKREQQRLVVPASAGKDVASSSASEAKGARPAKARTTNLPASASASRLPRGWSEAAIGEVTIPKVLQSEPGGHGEFRYVDIASVDNREKRIVEPKSLPVAKAPSRARQRIEDGDVQTSKEYGSFEEETDHFNSLRFVNFLTSASRGSVGFSGTFPRG